MYTVYILYSTTKNRYYVGYTSDLSVRLQKHNQGGTASIRSGIPWKLVYKEDYQSKRDAIIRERAIKRQKSRQYIESLLKMR